MLISVREAIDGPAAISAELGVRIRHLYADQWQTEAIELDFAGIRSVSPSFLSQATQPIILSWPETDIPARLAFTNVPRTFDLVWTTVLRAAETIKNSATDAA